jgi:hypothetical protein
MKQPMMHLTTVLATLVILPTAAVSKESVIYCPSEYPRSSVQLANPTDGWATLLQAPLLLHGAGVMMGPMDQRSISKPEPVRSYKGGYEDHYIGLGSLPLNQKWIWCGYGGWNDLILAKPLAQEIERCVVTYRRQTGGKQFEISHITCR